MKNKSVLIVEDNNLELLDQLEDYLSIDFDTVYSANNGEEGLEKIGERKLSETNNGFSWDNISLRLFKNDIEVSLSEYEQLFIKALYQKANECVTFIDLHLAINEDSEFSKNSITSIVKRIRQKTHKDFITTCYMQGFKLEIK